MHGPYASARAVVTNLVESFVLLIICKVIVMYTAR